MLTRKILFMVVGAVAVAGCATDADGPATAELPGGDALLMGNPSCAEAARRLGRDLGDHETRAEIVALGDKLAPSVEVRLDEQNRVVLSSDDGRAIDWHSDVGLDAVLVYGGRRTQAYVYDPEAREDSGLTAPRSKVDGAPPVAAVVLCHDEELLLGSVTSHASLVRTTRWGAELVPEHASVTVPAGVAKAVSFRATVAPTRTVDGGWTVRGEAVLTNPTHAPVEIVAVGDLAHALPVKAACGAAPPVFVPAFGSLPCHFEVRLPDGMPRTLELEVVTRGAVGHAVAAVPIDFDGAEVTRRDARAWVWDDHAGFLGVADGARAFHFEITIGPYVYCGSSGVFFDGLTMYGGDTGARTGARTSLVVKVPCN